MTHLAEIRVPEPQNYSENNGTNFTRGHMGQIKVIRCFVHFFLFCVCVYLIISHYQIYYYETIILTVS